MRHRVKKNRMNRAKGPRTLLLGNLATCIILNGSIQTTKAKAKAVQPLIDKLIICAKGTNKRLAIQEVSRYLHTEMSSKKLFNEIVKKYPDRETGFTRISEIGFRAGDAAPLVQIELV